MRNEDILKRLGVKPPARGFTRDWLMCNECKRVFYYDYIKGGLGRPITWLPCGHGLTRKLYEVTTKISETQAAVALRKEYSLSKLRKGK